MRMNAYDMIQQSCFTRLLDVRSYVLAARAACARLDPAPALFMVVVFGLITLALTPIWVVFDLASTWEFTTGLRTAAAPVIYEMSGRAESVLDLPVGALLTGIIFTGFTLLPSLFELAFPTVRHPLLNLVLLASIVFDYVTDWGKAAALAATWTANRALEVVYAAAFCLFVSVGVQAILVCCITVIIFGVLALLRGGARSVRAVVIE
jgi:hypothetical protein